MTITLIDCTLGPKVIDGHVGSNLPALAIPALAVRQLCERGAQGTPYTRSAIDRGAQFIYDFSLLVVGRII
jgi:hypothetical protein